MRACACVRVNAPRGFDDVHTHDVHTTTTTCTHSVGDRRRVDTLTTFVARCVVPPAHVLVVVLVVASIPGGACNVPRGMMLLRLLTAADCVMNDE